MSVLHPHKTPASGLRGLKENWRNDLIAAFSVAMVALPLSLGIAIASGVPPMAGLFAALVSGFVTTFVRGGHISINGPGNGLIAVILVGVLSLKDGSGNAYRYVLAAIVIAGALQILIGLLKLGKLGELFPSSVIHGILAAIGLIILGKQMHVALGAQTDAKTTLDVLLAIPASMLALNPYVALISVLCLIILVVYPRLENKLIHLIPAPMWVLLLAVPLALFFEFSKEHTYTLWGATHAVGPKLLVRLPESLLASVMLPDFSKINTLPFWSLVFSITLISSIETLISANAVDKLDPYKRTTDPNRELFGMGVSTMLSGFIGGLPIVTVIARSSVNIHNHAKTRWSNFLQSSFLLLFIVLFSSVIQLVPLASLAAILVYTGYKLTAPKVFADTYRKGWEQLFFLLVTLMGTLFTNLVGGLLIGTATTLIFHIFRTGTSPEIFLSTLWRTHFVADTTEDDQYLLRADGMLTFGNMLKLQPVLKSIPAEKNVRFDMSEVLLADLTILEYINDFAVKYRHSGGSFKILGLENHLCSSTYPHAMRVRGQCLVTAPARDVKVSRRQRELSLLAEENGWIYHQEIDWDASYLKNFLFFETRPIEYKENVLSGCHEEHDVNWEIADLTFDEGALLVEEYHTTVQVLYPDWDLPRFTLEREEFYDKLMEYVGHEEVDFKFFTKLSKKFVVKGYNKEEIERCFTKERIEFFENHDVYHLESNGDALLLFRRFRLERPSGIEAMNQFSKELLAELSPKTDTQAAHSKSTDQHVVEDEKPSIVTTEQSPAT